MSSASKTFSDRVLRHRDQLMKHFGILEVVTERVTVELQARQQSKAGSYAHDHAIDAEVELDALELAYLFDAEVIEYGFTDDDRSELVPDVNGASLELDLGPMSRIDALLWLKGELRNGTDMELSQIDCAADVRLWCLRRSMAPAEFYKETTAEALCWELDGRLKQAYFAYATALDAQINFALKDLRSLSEIGEHVRLMKLPDKLSLLVKWKTGHRALGSQPLYSLLAKAFQALIDRRNKIAHSLEAVVIGEDEIDEAVLVVLVLSMVLDTGSLSIPILTDTFDLKSKIKRGERMPSRTGDN